MEKRLFTSESVTEGHPDKMCDQISDAILDALMEQDPMSRVACETCATTGMVMVMVRLPQKRTWISRRLSEIPSERSVIPVENTDLTLIPVA